MQHSCCFTLRKSSSSPMERLRTTAIRKSSSMCVPTLEMAPSCAFSSIGCSTGEEVFSLRRYFPQASIKGIDINPFNIAICRRQLSKMGDEQTFFAVGGSTSVEPDAGYDAIFAMAVFRHGDLNVSPPPPKCDHYIRFADFEASVTDMARVLKPGGLLAIQGAMFRFADTSAASRFKAVLRVQPNEQVSFYDRSDCVLRDTDYSDVVFEKFALLSDPGATP